jgi:hypothetical protein
MVLCVLFLRAASIYITLILALGAAVLDLSVGNVRGEIGHTEIRENFISSTLLAVIQKIVKKYRE